MRSQRPVKPTKNSKGTEHIKEIKYHTIYKPISQFIFTTKTYTRFPFKHRFLSLNRSHNYISLSHTRKLYRVNRSLAEAEDIFYNFRAIYISMVLILQMNWNTN